MNKKRIAITIDVEPDYKTGGYEVMLDGIKKDENLFDKYKINPTLFVTCDCIERYPAVFIRLLKKGWELALHGYRHLRFDELSYDEKVREMEKAIACFKRYLKIKPKGMRAPQFSADFDLIKILDKNKFLYDSSKVQMPLTQLIFFRNKVGLYLEQIKFERKIKKERLRIKEIPVSSFILPVSFFTLNKLPLFIFNYIINLSLLFRKDNDIIVLSHSYEFDERRLRKIEDYIKNNKEAKFVRMEDLVKWEK